MHSHSDTNLSSAHTSHYVAVYKTRSLRRCQTPVWSLPVSPGTHSCETPAWVELSKCMYAIYLYIRCVFSPYGIKIFVCIVFNRAQQAPSDDWCHMPKSKRFSIINLPPPSRSINNITSSINEPPCAVMCHKSEADTKTANKAIDAAYDFCLRPSAVYGTHNSPYEVYRIDNQPSGAQQNLIIQGPQFSTAKASVRNFFSRHKFSTTLVMIFC